MQKESLTALVRHHLAIAVEAVEDSVLLLTVGKRH